MTFMAIHLTIPIAIILQNAYGKLSSLRASPPQLTNAYITF
jgi:hypothetical protein